jgi:hypothetical protein
MGTMMIAETAGLVAKNFGSRRLAADSARAAKLLTTVHLEDFPRPAEPKLPSLSSRWRQFRPTEDADRSARERDHADDLARWESLIRHDPSEVIATVDEALADNDSLSTCIDAGLSSHGNYVTVVVQYPGPEIVKGVVRVDGKTRPRTNDEMNQIYGDAVASTVIATAKEALTYAPAAVEAYIVVLRYDTKSWFSKKSDKLDAIYAGALNRKVLDIDWSTCAPIQVILGGRAVRINRDQKSRLKPLGDQAGEDLRRLVDAIAATNIEATPERTTRRRPTKAQSREMMNSQAREVFQAFSVCPECNEFGAHALREPMAGEPDWAKVIRSCATCGREWAQC